MSEELADQCVYEKVDLKSDFEKWIAEVRRMDHHQHARREADKARYPKRTFGEPSRNANVSTSAAAPAVKEQSRPSKVERPAKITQAERDLLAANDGCFKCRKPFVMHRSNDCTNGYPERKFIVDQKYIDSFKAKPKTVAAILNNTRSRDHS